ncbi:MAG: LCP family protein [Lachnospiraceae bacterium]|nr:LCP family protein [Lachnospiraceae bacterium]
MTKEEELRQLQELRRIQAEERARMQMQDTSYLEDSAFAPDNSYLNDSAFVDSAFVDSAFAPSGGIQNPMQNGYNSQNVQRPMQNVQRPMQNVQRPMQNVQRPTQNNSRNTNQSAPVRQRVPQQQNQNIDKTRNKKRKKKHPFLKFIAILLILIICICGIGAGLAIRALNKMDRVETNVSQRGGNFKGDIINILLIGQDAREGQGAQRADSIILCTINKSTHTVSLTSIMRDMYVSIPGYGSNRINAAFAFGGVDLLDQTIEENLGITIDGNLMVDFNGFMESMTAVGDLDIELTADEAAYMNEHPESGTANDIATEEWNLHEGVNTLTPSQLLSYSRIRHVGNSDWDRTNRQRKVIMAVVDKVKSGHLIKGIKVVNGVAPHITTDISSFNILKSGLAFVFSGGGNMQSYYLPAEGTYSAQNVNGMAVLVPDMEANRQILQQYMQGINPADN